MLLFTKLTVQTKLQPFITNNVTNINIFAVFRYIYRTMANFLNHVKSLIAALSVLILSLGSVAAIDNAGIDGRASNIKTIETVNPEPGNELGKTGKRETLKTDSLKNAGKIGENAKNSTENPSEVKKSENSSPSIFSYNFVFYLMYKFKIADIFNISKENNKIMVPDESSLISNGKRLISTIVNRITD